MSMPSEALFESSELMAASAGALVEAPGAAFTWARWNPVWAAVGAVVAPFFPFPLDADGLAAAAAAASEGVGGAVELEAAGVSAVVAGLVSEGAAAAMASNDFIFRSHWAVGESAETAISRSIIS